MPNEIVSRLSSHNDQISQLLTDEGRQQLDRLVLMEALVMARIHNATTQLIDGNFGTLAERGGLTPGEIAELNTEAVQAEITAAMNVPDFVDKLKDKCKSVANNKVKGWVKNLSDGDED